jgi:hypothetical protein
LVPQPSISEEARRKIIDRAKRAIGNLKNNLTCMGLLDKFGGSLDRITKAVTYWRPPTL